MNEMKQYVHDIEKKLRVDRATRRRIMSDLASDLQSRLDGGETAADIRADLGEPEQVAAGFNEAFADRCVRQSPLRWLFLAAALAVVLACLLADGAFTFGMSASEAAAIGVIGGADGPTAIFTAGTVASPLWEHLPLVLGLVCLFLMLGWCCADRQRCWVPAVLCGACTVGWMLGPVVVAVSMLGTGSAAIALSLLLDSFLSSGVWLCAGVLVWALNRLRN